MEGSDILYVGDHIYTDVHVSKGVRRWRTAVMVREIEDELVALGEFAPQQRQLDSYMAQKTALEFEHSQWRLELQRRKLEHPASSTLDIPAIHGKLKELRARMNGLDESIAPLAREASELNSSRWGLLMRAGNDKSHLARQIERHADIYTSRVSNFLFATPYAYLRSPSGSLPHDTDGKN